jgi:Holliday junction resolvasome RuvABC ATP-dependent DNA helicase subunit
MTTDFSRRIIAELREIEAEFLGLPAAQEPVFLGQEQLKRRVKPFLNRDRPFPHTLIVGEPGVGKTVLARWLAYQKGEPFQENLAPVAVEDLLERGLFLIDEAHNQTRPERLFPIMEAPGRELTILAASTQPEKLDSAFRSRFFLKLHMGRLDESDMGLIVRHLAEKPIDDDTVNLFASASAGNPRQAELIMETAHGIDSYDAEEVLSTCGITAEGLDQLHMTYLKTLHSLRRPVGLIQLSAVSFVDESTLRGHERLLLEQDLIELSSKGRSLTKLGKAYVDELER